MSRLITPSTAGGAGIMRGKVITQVPKAQLPDKRRIPVTMDNRF